MDISCTKKLLETLGETAAPKSSRTPFYDWHVHIITKNRRKMLVLLNDYTHSVITLYGVRIGDLKDFRHLVTNAMREMLLHAGFSEEDAALYLQKAGGVKITKTKRNLIASMNQVTQMIGYYSTELEEGMQQWHLSEWLDDSPVKAEGKDYIFPKDELYKAMDMLHSGEEIKTGRPALIFDVWLPLGEDGAERVVAVSPDITFKKFHIVLQRVFEWQDEHMHEFTVLDEKSEPVAQVEMDVERSDYFDEEQKFVDCRLEKIKLSTYFPKYNKLYYTYDFGDDWLHMIELKEYVADYNGKLPACLSGEGDAPPEDVGGEDGYMDFMETIANNDDPEHDETLEWATSLGWAHFNLERINQRLK